MNTHISQYVYHYTYTVLWFYFQGHPTTQTLFLFSVFIPRYFSSSLFPRSKPLHPLMFLWSPWVEKQVTINIGAARSSRRETASALKSLTDSPGAPHTQIHTHTHSHTLHYTCKGYDNAKHTPTCTRRVCWRHSNNIHLSGKNASAERRLRVRNSTPTTWRWRILLGFKR